MDTKANMETRLITQFDPSSPIYPATDKLSVTSFITNICPALKMVMAIYMNDQ